MTADQGRYSIESAPRFAPDLSLLRSRAKADPARHAYLYREVLREIERLRAGTSDGHHPLGYEVGRGDLWDCVTAYVQSDPERKADHRLVFREIGPAAVGELPRRELLAIKPRHGSGNVYEHACARLNRHPSDRQPGLNCFGDRPAGSGGNQAQRQAELDTKRAIAHAWAGQQPLASSRPLALPGLTQPTTTKTTAQRRSRVASRGPAGHPGGQVGPRNR